MFFMVLDLRLRKIEVVVMTTLSVFTGYSHFVS